MDKFPKIAIKLNNIKYLLLYTAIIKVRLKMLDILFKYKLDIN